MGLTYIRVSIYHPISWEKGEEVELLINTGGIVTVVPREILEELEVKPLGKREFRIFGGRVIEREVSGALIKYEDRYAVVPVAFGEERDTAVIGATALESLGYQVDPVTKQLKKVELLLL